MGDRPFPLKENVFEYLKELKERKAVDEQLNAEEAKLKADQEEKRKVDLENLKFDVDAVDKDNAAEKDETVQNESKKEKKDDDKKE